MLFHNPFQKTNSLRTCCGCFAASGEWTQTKKACNERIEKLHRIGIHRNRDRGAEVHSHLIHSRKMVAQKGPISSRVNIADIFHRSLSDRLSITRGDARRTNVLGGQRTTTWNAQTQTHVLNHARATCFPLFSLSRFIMVHSPPPILTNHLIRRLLLDRFGWELRQIFGRRSLVYIVLILTIVKNLHHSSIPAVFPLVYPLTKRYNHVVLQRSCKCWNWKNDECRMVDCCSHDVCFGLLVYVSVCCDMV